MKRFTLLIAAFLWLPLSSCKKGAIEPTEIVEVPAPTPTPEPTPTPTPHPAATQGKLIFDKLKQLYPPLKIDIFGSASDSPKVALWVPERDWSSLSKDEQISLGYYVKSQVSIIRANPDPYSGIPSTAPIYRKVIGRLRTLSDNAWIIGTGRLSPQGQIFLDQEVIDGYQEPWYSK